MAPIDKVKGNQLYIKIGDGGAPEVFSHPCLINTKRGVKFQSSTNEEIVPDCDNPDDPAWSECFKDGLKITVDGAGKLDIAGVPMFDAWWRNDLTKNVQLWLGTRGYWQVPMKLPSWDITGERKTYCEASLNLQSAGAGSAWTPV